MRRKVWQLLKKKDVSDKLDYTVKSAWYKFAPVDGVFKFASAFWNLDPKVSDRFEIIDSNTNQRVVNDNKLKLDDFIYSINEVM